MEGNGGGNASRSSILAVSLPTIDPRRRTTALTCRTSSMGLLPLAANCRHGSYSGRED